MRNYACDTTAAPLLRAFTQAFSHKRYFATSIATFESKIAGRITAPFKQLVLICVCCDMRSICLDLQKTTFRCVFRSTANCATPMGHLPPLPFLFAQSVLNTCEVRLLSALCLHRTGRSTYESTPCIVILFQNSHQGFSCPMPDLEQKQIGQTR